MTKHKTKTPFSKDDATVFINDVEYVREDLYDALHQKLRQFQWDGRLANQGDDGYTPADLEQDNVRLRAEVDLCDKERLHDDKVIKQLRAGIDLDSRVIKHLRDEVDLRVKKRLQDDEIIKQLRAELEAKNVSISGLERTSNELRRENAGLWMLNTGIKGSYADLEAKLAASKPSWDEAPEKAYSLVGQWFWQSEGNEHYQPINAAYIVEYRPEEE